MASDPRALALKAAEEGPILTCVWGEKVAICVTSLPVARRLLQERGEDLKSLSIDIASVVPKGMLRTMEGLDHKTYRTRFAKAISASGSSDQTNDVQAIIAEALASSRLDDEPTGGAYDELAIRLLLRTFLGVPLHSDHHRHLETHFKAMAPNGFAWTVGPIQKSAFEAIRGRLVGLVSNKAGEVLSDSVLGCFIHDASIDPVTIGNLIYMVEMGRHYLALFFYRIAKFMSTNWTMLRRIDESRKSDIGVTVAEAVVLETLRFEQSERLMRAAKRDFIFDGFLFPRGAVVRICLWEAHRDGVNFEGPFSFEPDRFLEATYTPDQFSPFGLGHHRCPAAVPVLQYGSLFVEAYVRRRLS
ncbi:cytochrome P450 [Mesorhizobium sp. ZMM04-5]|uniref:Cytochrome P450 n=1 Tax=Mesorhizobium marinum TaxID=3228790 RepID=A0ABV3QVA6_9HYPH